MAIVLGIDLGTQGAKALVVDAASGRVLGRGASPLSVDAPRPGAAEQGPDAWIDAVTQAVRGALAAPGVDAAAVCAVGVSGQQHGCVALDAADRPVRPAKLWCDTECTDEAREFGARIGRSVPAGFTAPKLVWMKSREPANFARVRRVLLPHDWVNLFLTGDAFTDCGDASGTGYFDAVARTYDRRAMDAVDPGLHAMVPRLVGADAVGGTLRAAAAHALGLRAGIPVSAGSGDNMMSALGAGAVDHGTLVVSLGTSGTLFGPADRAVVDPTGLIAPFCDATGRWLPLLCTMNCTVVTEEVRTCFGLPHGQLTELATAEPIGAGGVTFLPYLQGERAPNWPHARGVIHGLEPGSMRPGPLYRAALEGATLALVHGASRLAALGLPARELCVVGGGSRNALWRRILADAFGVPLRFPAEPESAALGAALQAAAVASGTAVSAFVRARRPPMSPDVVEPIDANVRAYRDLATRFDALGERLFGAVTSR
ncbi:MAG: xylulokinase [Phycisphaerales bacterium]|nr:xylulokinase [Phycisphaerales bacterium]